MCALAAPVQAAPAMWVVRDADSEIYLFGSLHALPAGAAWRTPAYDAAYAKASTVWFEADVDLGRDQLIALVSRYGVDRERGLSDKLSPQDLKRLRAVLARQGVPLERVDALRPWVAALMLSIGPAAGRGGDVSHGVDMVVTREVKASSKALRTFETAEDQIRMFADLPEAVQVRYLSDVLAAQTRTVFWPTGTFQGRWLSGRVAGQTAQEDPGLREALIVRRNHAWADALAGEMDGAGVQLVNVGALHMAGVEGLPALLKARGFSVERVQ
jgi:uncharacterized protein YbaP (TraB family)